MATVCEECRNCDWFWEDRDSDKECLGEEQPCEKFMCLKNQKIRRLRSENSGLRKELDERPTWVSVKDKIPKRDGDYLVYGTWNRSGDAVIDVVFFNMLDGYFRAAWNFHITHWMNLPNFPNEVHEPVHYWTPLPDIKTLFEEKENGNEDNKRG